MIGSGAKIVTTFPTRAATITPSDTTDLGYPGVIRVGGAGNVAYTTHYGDTITLTDLAVGEYIPNVVRRVLATGTTATNLTVHW
jgi:uncharacterized circularly permuted ATP-grasp superfamily protein